MKKYDTLKKSFPVDFNTLTKIQGLGAKKVYRLYKELGIKNIDDLKKAVQEHRIMDLEGFGEKSELEIGKGLALLESNSGRMLLGRALPEAEKIIAQLRDSGLAERAELYLPAVLAHLRRHVLHAKLCIYIFLISCSYALPLPVKKPIFI